ncbi:MAG: hypothetical protein MJ092_05640 [Lachnospiraceae bacterium]|nr:hypothetical protein [Lachnospiraceae bacterium]
MMNRRKNNWYFDGWMSRKELTPSGRWRTVWEYNDDYYGFDLQPKQLKLLKYAFIFIPALILVVWFASSLTRSIGRDTVLYVGAFWYATAIPMVYMVIGAIGAFKIKEKMTYRDLYACYRRLMVSSWFIAPLFFLSIVGDIVFLVLYKDYFSIQTELPWLIGAFIDFLLAVLLFIVQLKNKSKIVQLQSKSEDE